jgi:LacI family transcriptional regulator, gluconate utilization system Gnt-I transcriptional repressor
MREIAERAQVTKMTVSRALRTPAKVAPETLRRIRLAMEELNFVPNQVALSLTERGSRIVPVIVPSLASSIFSDFIEELSRSLDFAGFTPVVGCSSFDVTFEEKLLVKYLGWQPRGVVLTGASHTPETRALCQRAGLAVVQTWSLPDDPFDIAVGFSNFDAMRKMVASLRDWGYRRIGFGYVDAVRNDRTADRRAGWLAALQAAGDTPLDTRTQGAAFGTPGGAEILRGILRRHPDTDAIAFGSDVLAVGAVLECRRMGLRVPEDIAITGFGDMGLASIISPTLTTVRLPVRELGRVCAETLVGRMENTYHGPARVDLGFEIVRRESA